MSNTKTLQANLRTLGISRQTYQTLKELSSIKILRTDGIDAFLKILDTNNLALLSLFSKSKTYLNFKNKCEDLVSIKSLPVLTASLSKIKPINAFDRFIDFPENYNPMVFEEYSRFVDYFLKEPLNNVSKLKLDKGLIKLSSDLFLIQFNTSKGLVFGKTQPNLELLSNLENRKGDYFMYVDTMRSGGPLGDHFEPLRNTTVVGDWSDIVLNLKKHLKI